MKELNEKGRKLVEDLIAASHVEAVLEVCRDHCETNGNWARHEMKNNAIAREWEDAAKFIEKAIEEIGQ